MTNRPHIVYSYSVKGMNDRGYNMRVLLTGGGTAGHVNPALAIGDLIREREPDSVIEYIGTEKGIEGRLVPRRNIKLHTIKVRGLSRSLSPSNLRSLAQAFGALKKCRQILRAFRPDVVIGTGGYVCWAPIRAAVSLGIPTVLHESNAQPGFAVKTLCHKVDLILVNFEGTKRLLEGQKTRVERVGMPVNKAFSDKVTQPSRPPISALESNRDKPFHILSFGGSLGAHTLNLCALKLAKTYASQNPQVFLEHSCGTREYEQIREQFEEEGLSRFSNLTFCDYIYDMPGKMMAADLVICRSGASTLAELAVAGKAALLIPSPNVTGDQQRKNANQLLQKGAAVVLEDSLAEAEIVDRVDRLISDRSKLSELRKNIREFAVMDCDERIYRAIRSLVDPANKG